MKNARWDDIAMLDGNGTPTDSIDKAYFIVIKTKKGYDFFISSSNDNNCSTYGIEQANEKLLEENVFNKGFVWNYRICGYIPFEEFLKREYETIRKYENFMLDCLAKTDGDKE